MSEATDREASTVDVQSMIEKREQLIALELDLTPELRRALLEFARRRERMVVCAGLRSARGEAASWVADAIADTAIGTVTWASGVDLRAHLVGVIRGRTTALARDARRRPHISIDDPNRSRSQRAALVGEVGTVDSTAAAIEARQELDRVVAFVEATAPDATVIALAHAYRGGAETVADAGRLAGLTSSQTKDARRRLDRVLARMRAGDEVGSMSESGTW